MSSKPKTQAKLDRATDLRLRKTYGVGLDWYNETLAKQGGCAVCEDLGKTRRLNIDHDHAWKKVKIRSFKEEAPYLGSWAASGLYNGTEYTGYGKTKSLAIRMVKDKLKVASIRGLLCHRCNRALILLRDDVGLLGSAIAYLEKHRGVL